MVAVSKPLPKLFHDLEQLQAESLEKVKLTINKNGSVVATTLDIKTQKRSKENERK